MIPVKSSLIKAIDYDPDTEKLTVEFKSGGKYVYSAVSEQIWDNFRNSHSIGSFFMANIKGNYPYESIKDVAPA
jgi:hypothetical protein